MSNEDIPFLIRRIRRGERAAFDSLVHRFEAKVYSIALKHCGNFHDAKDITQETFLRVFRHLDTFDADKSFEAWLARIAVHCARDFFRRNAVSKTRQDSTDALFNGPSPLFAKDENNAEDRLDRRLFVEAVLKHLQTLPENQRTAFILKDLEGYATRDIAEILECRDVTVRRHVSEARKKIRKALEKDFPACFD